MIERKDQKIEDTWDLKGLSKTEKAWHRDLKSLRRKVRALSAYRGRLSESSESLLNALSAIEAVSIEAERLGEYAFLSFEADSSNPDVQSMFMEFNAFSVYFSESISWFTPELMSVDEGLIRAYMKEPGYSDFRVFLRKSLRERKHVLSEKEERIMSLFSHVSGNAEKTFMDLNNIDLTFGAVGKVPLTHSTYSVLIRNPKNKIRKEAYFKYYDAFDRHKNTICSLYSASIEEDVFCSKARNFKSSLEASLFSDSIPTSVYTSLIEAVRSYLPVLHEYYDVKSSVLNRKLRHYDVYLPMVAGIKKKYPYDSAVSLIEKAMEPLGKEYVETLVKGLTTDRWVDRYENKGKRSGAFSAGSYTGKPYILTNYEENVLDSVFTLIHEGGHSMHSLYSKSNNPYMSYNYSIFEAEVASTFNENLLSEYLLNNSESEEEKLLVMGKNLDDIVATLFRQTMFAEFELKVHQIADKGNPLTLDIMRGIYRGLLEDYFGGKVKLFDVSDLEFLRVPHFYSSFYCFKYATGISASIALSKMVLSGGEKEREKYMGFLKSGGSKYPIQALKKAGVDMSKKESVIEALNHFENLLHSFRSLCSV